MVDTNILLDLATSDALWYDWSLRALETAALDGPIVINCVVYGELSARYDSIEEVDDFVERAGAELIDIPRAAAFVASKAYARYRSAGGTKTGVLSDFFIGAQALVLDIPILTRDVRRYRSYFPNLRLISPQIN